MNFKNRGIYPDWMDDKEIINQILNEIIRAYGRLHYSYIISPEQKPESQERMRLILDRMAEEKLLLHPVKENDFLEMDIHGGWAAKIGYRKYKRVKRWLVLQNRLRSVYNVFFALAVIALIGILGYLMFFHIKGA